MKTSGLRKTTLLSLIGLSTAQTSSWAEAFTVGGPSSTDNLLAEPTTSWGQDQAFTVDNTEVSTPASSLPTSEGMSPSLAVDTAAPTVAPGGPVVVTSETGDATTSVISGIPSVISNTASFQTGSVTTMTGNLTRTIGAPSGTQVVEATGGAAPVKGLKKMGFAGALAGAAGVMFV
jgi:hypothetical protein